MRTLSKVAGCLAEKAIPTGYFIMRRPKLILSQLVLGAAAAFTLILSWPNSQADAVSPDREDWFVRCERAQQELAVQVTGRADSSLANSSINRRTLSACAEQGFLPAITTIR